MEQRIWVILMNAKEWIIFITIAAFIGYFIFSWMVDPYFALVAMIGAWLLALPGALFGDENDEDCQIDYIIIEKKERLDNHN